MNDHLVCEVLVGVHRGVQENVPLGLLLLLRLDGDGLCPGVTNQEEEALYLRTPRASVNSNDNFSPRHFAFMFDLINLLLSKCSVFDFTMAMISAPLRHSSQLGGVALLLGRLRPRVP